MTHTLPDHLTPLVVPEDRLDTYLNRHHLVYKKFKNGASILGGSGRDPNSATAEVDVSFATGSAFDQQDTIGELHFLEHLINKPLRTYAESIDVNLNASTSYYNMTEHMSGTLAPGIDGYGVHAITDKIMKRLENPTAGYDDLKATVDSEREIIKNEIDRNLADHNWHNRRHLLEAVLAPGNPILAETAGTHESLDRIDEAVLKRVAGEICTAPLLTAQVYNHGDPKTLDTYLKQLELLLEAYPTTDLKHHLDWTRLDQLRADKGDRISTHTTGLKNNYASITFVWHMDAVPFMLESTALNLYTSYLHEKVHKYAREHGIGYLAYAQNYGLFEKKLFVIQFDTSHKKEADLRTLQKRIEGEMNEVLFSDDQAAFAHITQKEQKRQQANPIATDYCLWLLEKGLEWYDTVLDAAMLRERAKDVRASHISAWNEYLRTTPAPVITITGDL